MIKKIILLGVLVIMIFSLSACGNKYNAVMYSDAKLWMNEEFLKENSTYGTIYDKGEEIDWNDRFFTDKTSPEFRVHIIKEQSQFDEIFLNFPPKINFENEMLLIYVFSDIYPNRAYNIKHVKLDDKTLIIDFKIERSSVKDASQPMQRCLVVKMNKLDIATAEFIENN